MTSVPFHRRGCSDFNGDLKDGSSTHRPHGSLLGVEEEKVVQQLLCKLSATAGSIYARLRGQRWRSIAGEGHYHSIIEAALYDVTLPTPPELHRVERFIPTILITGRVSRAEGELVLASQWRRWRRLR